MKKLLISVLLFVLSAIAHAQVGDSLRLFGIISANDSLLFDAGFNHCDIAQTERLLSDNFEFYHDEAGPICNKSDFLKSMRNNVCALPYRPRRALIANTLQVYPMLKNGAIYGAVETSEHAFYAVQKDKACFLTCTAKFTSLWVVENGTWKLSRVLSYDHTEPHTGDTTTPPLLFTDKVQTEMWMTQNHIPALGIGYIKDGVVKEISVYGRNEDGEPYAGNTLFNVASLTKPVTALVALKLVDEHKWDLDEPLCHYWTDPDVANDPRLKKLTTRFILSHKSGFPNWKRNTADGKLVFEFEPGTKFQYSGEGFEYLRKALESKFKKPLDQLAAEWVFRPLGMSDTHYFWDSSVDAARFATWHKQDGSLYETFKNTSANGADDLITTIPDYCRLMISIMNGAGVSNNLFSDMTHEHTYIKPRKHYGLGWWIDSNVNGSESALVHGGDDIGVHAIAFILPQSKEGLLIFTNCDNGRDVYATIVRHYLGTIGEQIIDVETK